MVILYYNVSSKYLSICVPFMHDQRVMRELPLQIDKCVKPIVTNVIHHNLPWFLRDKTLDNYEKTAISYRV